MAQLKTIRAQLFQTRPQTTENKGQVVPQMSQQAQHRKNVKSYPNGMEWYDYPENK